MFKVQKAPWNNAKLFYSDNYEGGNLKLHIFSTQRFGIVKNSDMTK